jgi:hypothetical protein
MQEICICKESSIIGLALRSYMNLETEFLPLQDVDEK